MYLREVRTWIQLLFLFSEELMYYAFYVINCILHFRKLNETTTYYLHA